MVSASRGDLDLALPHAHRLDEHDVAPGRVEHPHGACGVAHDSPPRWPREAIERMNTSVSVAWSLHPDPVAEQGAAGERRRRVDGQHADPRARGAR